MFQTKVVQKIKTFLFDNIFPPKIVPFMRSYGTVLYSRTGHRWCGYGACALHAG